MTAHDGLDGNGALAVVNNQSKSTFVSLTKQLMELDEKQTVEQKQTIRQATLSPVSHITSHENFSFPTQLFLSYILVPYPDKFLVIHQQAAHERIIYERLAAALQGKPVVTQRSLFPATIEVTPADAVLLTELLPDLQLVGYSIEVFGKNAFIIQGTPADIDTGNEKAVLEKILERYKHFSSEVKLPKREMLLRTVAWQQSIKPGMALSEKEMEGLVSDLFSCHQPNATSSGRPTYLEFKKDSLEKMFMR
jgi:DNA mismatch repair protein MutL